MADVKKIKLPDNSVYNIKDYRIPGVDTVPTSGSGNVITSGGIYAANYAGSDSNGGPALKTYGIPYGAVDSASTATVITATVDNFPTELRDGVCAYIRNDIVSSASGWTLNVNGTGAKPVYTTTADATRVTTQFSAATTYLFIYNSTRVSGGCWDLYYGYDSNTDNNAYQIRTNAVTAPTKNAFYRYRLLFTSPDGQYIIPANTSTSIDATASRNVTQEKIDPFGPIWYYNTTAVVNANASVGVSYLWMQYSGISLGYSFNRTGAALTLTAKDPVYIKCAPQTDGSAIIDANTPFVQSLPSTEDGKIYIFLGYADSATAVTLYYWHPVYYYKDNAIRLWTNAADTTITVDTELDLESENPISNGAVTQVIFDNEQVTAAALNDLRDDISTIDKVTASSLNDLNDRMLEAEGTLSEMDEYVSDLGEVTSAALNDLNDRTTALETEDSPKQRYFVGTSDQEQYDMDSYIKSEVPNPQEGDIFIPYDTSKRYTDIVKVGSETITFDDYQNQGWPSSTGTFIRYTAPDAQNAYLEIVANSTGTYKFYGIHNISSDYYEYPSFEASITSGELCSDGKYRLLLSTWVDGGILLYYTGSDPNIEINRCAPFGWSNFEYINGSWCDRSMLEQKVHEYITVGEIYDNENNYPSNSALLAHLKSYPKVSSGVSSYDSVKDKYIRFSWIEFVSQQNSSQGVSIYLRCSTSSTTPKTVQVSTSGYSSWTDKTPDTLDENGRYYVLLGTLTTSNHDLYVKGNNTSYGDSSNYCYFDISGPCYLSGDMISLVGGHTGGSDNNDISDDVYAQNYTFPFMFKNQTNIFSHPTRRLYMITQRISTYGYYYTFVGCENMIVSPIISGSPKGSYALNGMFTHCYNMKVSLCDVSAMIGRTWYPWLPSGVCQTDGHVIYNPGGSYYSNYDISVGTNDTYYGLFTDIINSENTILFNKVTSLVSNNSSLLNNDMLPNKVYDFGTLTSSQTFSLSTTKRPGIPHYFWTFDIGATIPNITWPSGLIWPEGNPPTLKPNHHYEFSVLDNVVAWMEV